MRQLLVIIEKNLQSSVNSKRFYIPTSQVHFEVHKEVQTIGMCNICYVELWIQRSSSQRPFRGKRSPLQMGMIGQTHIHKSISSWSL